MTALLRTTGTLLAARCGLRLQIAGMTAAHCEWSGESIGSKQDGEKAAAAGAGADVVWFPHCDDEIFFNADLLHIFLWPNDMPMISIWYAKETSLSLLRDDKSTGIGYLSTIRFCEWEEKETRKTRICDVSYSSQWQREKDGLRQEKYAEEPSCC